ncbi:MAG: hypothetical protein QCI00_09640 [Candidatus Thermoplasmatota archaeon]|nr:hypothetical protein [Candidatus Thermoplasmatota archaeon]
MLKKNLLMAIILAIAFLISNYLSFFYGYGASSARSSIGISADNYIIALVALYGALLSSYTFYETYLGKQYLVKTEIGYGITTDYIETYRSYSIEAKNIGERTVVLSQVSFLLPDSKQIIIQEPLNERRLPHKLGPGESFLIEYPMQKLNDVLENEGLSDLAEISARYKDQLGNNYDSKPILILKN